MTIPQFEALFPTDDACKGYLVARCWPKGVRCPRCDNDRVYPVANRPFHWQCTKCAPAGGCRFSVLVATIFENTNVGLRTWFRVIHMMLTAKKGVSSLQVQRVMGIGSYRTALYMTHRVRAGLQDPEFRKLVGIVEVDETYIGGSDKNRHWDKKSGTRGRGDTGKTAVVGAVRRKGNVVARVVENTGRSPHLKPSSARRFRTALACSALMPIPAISALSTVSRINRSTIPSANMSSARSTPTRLRVSGRSSSAASSGLITKSAANICRSMLQNLNFAITIGTTPTFSARL